MLSWLKDSSYLKRNTTVRSTDTLFVRAVSLFSAFVQNSQRYMKPLLMCVAALFSAGGGCVPVERAAALWFGK